MPGFTEEQLYKVLELGAKEQEVAEPAEMTVEQDLDEGAKAQEPAAPAAETTGNEENQNTETNGEENVQSPADAEAAQKEGKTPQTEEQRRENAARRRREEQQAAIQSAVEEALRLEREKQAGEMKAFFESAGLKNTITGEAITDMEGFRSWKKSFDEAKLQSDLKAGKLTPDILGKLVADAVAKDPIVQQARQIVERHSAAEAQQKETATMAETERQLAEIRKMDPSIKTLGDLLKAPNAKAFYEAVNRGNNFVDAYYLANRERLEAEAAEKARQQAMSNARGKDHLSVTAARGAGAVTVPTAEMQMYRAINPDASDAEIQRFANKYSK